MTPHVSPYRRILRLTVVVLLAVPPLFAQEHPGDDYLELETVERDDGEIEFRAYNRHIVPLWIHIEFPRLEGYQADVDLPFAGLVPLSDSLDRESPSRRAEESPPGRAENNDGTVLFSLKPEDGARRLAYQIRYTYARGRPDEADHDDNHVYLMPFEHGKRYRLDQGYNGEFTHYEENKYALDFAMDEGTPIHAARSGTVIEVKDDSARGGASTAYAQEANYIFVLHEDGSVGNYVHLERGGAQVAPGDEVEAGERIGLSGNTGQSSGPHLHFDVRVPTRDGRMQSIPTRFRHHDGTTVDGDLREGAYYYARHPGGEDFEVELGSELENEDYEDHSRSIERSDSIDFDTEQIDDTTVVYVRNGFEQDVSVEIDFQLQGLDATTPESVEMEIPRLTERFLTILRPKESASRMQYGFDIRYNRIE
ncbi:MAG: M23 family metallopeptidase [Spirochaetales bacterium]